MQYFKLSLFIVLCGCGDPSPWYHFQSQIYRSLTQKNLDLLREGTEDFEPFKVALTADPQVVVGFLQSCRTEINKRNDIDFSLLLGDLTDRSLGREFEWVADIIRDFRRPMLTVVGNHDGLIYGNDLYQKMFGDLNYSFIYNDVKFIMWNNNPYEWGYPDIAWLEQEIESHPRVVIGSHQPPGSVERYPEINAIWEGFYANPNVLGSVHGHLHNWIYREISGKPVLTVARVTDTNWGIMEFDDEGNLIFHKCQGSSCEALP
ncbi:metallophosphoesterase family protein [Pseudobacteriovorax antillogorgiicola]|uniref:Calcineurin-like phosphoesterase n=1 Tax=Pseudobacteriovorax antillogorgiicola TaxID=1513793 RepID=A0A1Y6BND4_9BACT|nr:metallophosphoesterase [Pseudobacteriovorax antillogorgiicola]TCS55428.1 calcineurin-like phosphoesterase family protein [Pseudobacteriovorax antillogorgiicola]SMF12538.1 Calcineurin-like phosphoesterase [Pseudobacteriovorax antillogorgiicola]